MHTTTITSDPAYRWGTPCVRDTGITAAYVISLRRSGWDTRRILESCPRLTAADVDAVDAWHAEFGDAALGPQLPPPGPDHPRIAVDPDIQSGYPVVNGTRITVDALCGLRDAGFTAAQILAEYPQITSEDLQAAFAFDAEVRGR
ncbi:MAG: hypothetical protein NVSMB12_05280 [Acidimicrobiales bacterium]